MDHVYNPERLFMSNLFSFCNCSPEAFLNHLNDQLIDDINEELTYMLGDIRDHPQKAGYSLLPNSFIKKIMTIEKMLERFKQSEAKRNKLPDYCLINLYMSIKNAHIEIINSNFKSRATNLEQNDKEIIEQLSNCIRDLNYDYNATAASKKNFMCFFDKTGGAYKSTQTGLIEYILRDIFPKYTDKTNVAFFEKIKKKQWFEVVLEDTDINKEVLYICGSQDRIKEATTFFEESFSTFSCYNEDRFGEVLVQMYYKIQELYKNDCLSSVAQEVEDSVVVPSKITDVSPHTNPQIEYNSILSTHILSFLRWISLISHPPYQPELMMVVDNVIDALSDYLQKDSEIFERLISLADDKCAFITIDNPALIKRLIIALYQEDYILSLFYDCYGIPNSKGDIVV